MSDPSDSTDKDPAPTRDENDGPAGEKGDGAACSPLRERMARRFALAVDWLDDRTAARSAVRRFADRPVPRGFPWDSLWPSMIVFTFVVQLVTGFFLWIFYSPSAQTAWESVYYLQYDVTGGWLLRGVHHYAAQVLVGLAVLYVVYLVVRGAYRAPRECVYWVAVLMGMASLALCLTGDLLAWDQNSYASTLVRVRFAMILPWIGDDLFKLAAGGPAFGHLTLTRFFALHVAFAGGFLALLALHGWLPYRAVRKGDDAEEAKESAKPDGRYWPDRLVYHAGAWLVVAVVVGLLVARHAFSGDHAGARAGDYLGVALGAPADTDPANFYAAARPEWSFRGLYQLSNLFPGDAVPLLGISWKAVPIFVIPGTVVLLILAFPFIARWKHGHGANVAILGFLLVAVVLLSAASWRHDFADEEHQAALAAGEAEADRAKELARSPSGIPVSGALSLLRSDPKTQGPKVYENQCVVCHNYGAPGDEAIVAEPPSAPDLYGFAGRRWVAGLLDPEEVKSPRYYGNTKFATGVMVRYVEGPFAELDEQEQTAIIAALSAEAGIPSQRGLDRKDVVAIEKGRELIVAHCTRCHAFQDEGQRGYAPDLTDYGSQEWVVGIVADPTHDWFYGERNDRMPVYLEVPEEPAKNRMQANEVRLVADWLRGDWYEPSGAAEGGAADEAATPASVPAMLTVGKWIARRGKPAPVADTASAQARALFHREHCGICHDYTGAPGGDVVARDPSAPDLGGFASRAWIAGLLDPEQIKTRKYFGNSNFRGGRMVEFVEEMFSDLLDEEKKEVESLVIALSAEAQLPAQREMDQKDAQRIEAGREAISAWGCTDCHRFHDQGDHVGPDLTGYGSSKWLTAFIGDPADGSPTQHDLLFYGDDNYGMPSYRRFRPEAIEGDTPEAVKARKQLAEKENLNLLSADQLRLLVDLLRGELLEE
jgi:ubiquinol-cytochrome c reductase cytochrome b subunit